jgi:glycosyltransferase involved in cell wall biosynthesis
LAAELPFVTVVMPIRNEANFIASSLDAVLEQDYPHDHMEVLIADGMSTDNTRAVVAQTAALHPDISVRLVDNPGKAVPSGLNILHDQARGSIIVRVDGHCKVAPDYISRCVEHLLPGDVAAVGGPIETIGSTPMGDAIAVAMSSPFGVGNSAFRTVKDRAVIADTVPFPAYTRQAIEAAGPYKEEMTNNQDDEYNFRLRSLGFKILLSPDIRSRYYGRNSLGSLGRQYYNYGFWKVRVLQYHPLQMSLRQFVPPMFVLSIVMGGILMPFSKVIRVLWIGSLALYTVANLSASLWTAMKTGWSNLFRLPVIFATLHVSYGWGFLMGLVKFGRYFFEPEPDATPYRDKEPLQ